MVSFRATTVAVFGILHVVVAAVPGHSLILNKNVNTSASDFKRGSFQDGSVYCKKRDCKFVSGTLDWHGATAVGAFNDTLLSTGWGILDISSGFGPSQTNEEIMYAAGFMEGVLTFRQMESQFTNLFSVFFPKPDKSMQQKLEKWFTTQRAWADQMASNYPDDPLWRHSSYIFAQLDGLYAGYKSVRGADKTALDFFAINFLNANGDLFDIMTVLQPSESPDWTTFTADEAANFFYTNGHCSALIKILPGYENIFMSHSSWFAYQATNRIYKHYNFNVDDPSTAAKRVSFSSYGGYLESLDDFYQMDSGLVMLQTTNNIFNKTLHKYVTPQALLAWQRVRIANMMAHGGKEWAQVIAKYNSGSYNNQYMVLDLKLITPKKPLPDNTLWVAEQIPGLVVAEDTTPILRAGYFPSYNIPFFEEIFVKSGYPEYVKKHGIQYTYDLAPRASIFRRDQGKVKDMESMKAIMRYNDYKNDPYSYGSPWGAICSRGDLVKGMTMPDGCYDTKVADLAMAKAFQADIINGPTLGNDFPPFSWTGKYANYSHAGLPLTYDFSFVRTQPRF
ncbi:phospholipase B-like 1 [Aplysia californica]|uniref:Phospholipase B-like n=1 Tax=Aplysia californica TaxID=6500 RepID=A0ABM0JLJ1_APLCA|nr:phospholipase B-like 1 [Aplysia californica]